MRNPNELIYKKDNETIVITASRTLGHDNVLTHEKEHKKKKKKNPNKQTKKIELHLEKP